MIIIHWQCQVFASQPQNGDVRLNYVNDNFYNFEGVLEIYISDIHIWIPVCLEKFNKGAAITACKQMGYSTISTAQADNEEGFVKAKPYVHNLLV